MGSAAPWPGVRSQFASSTNARFKQRISGVFHVDVSRRVFRSIFYNLHGDVRAHRTFESSFVVIWYVRLDAREPHLRPADFTERTTDNSLLRKRLIFSHATPLGRLAWHTHELTASTKRSRPTSLDSHLQTRGI